MMAMQKAYETDEVMNMENNKMKKHMKIRQTSYENVDNYETDAHEQNNYVMGMMKMKTMMEIKK